MLRRCLLLLLCSFYAFGSWGSGGAPLSYRKVDFEYTGTVFDAVTKQPIEGAYVFASYREDVGPEPAYKSRCVKTRGMYTGKDGKYHFPIDKLDGQSPWLTSAIKPGYYFRSFDVPTREAWRKQDASTYSNMHVYLIPQDPAKPSFLIGSGEEHCYAARTKEDAAAAAKFLKLEVQELIRYGASEQVVRAGNAMIKSLESLPSAAPANTSASGDRGK